MARLDMSAHDTHEFAAQGVAQSDSMFELGLIACSGRNGPVDLVEAHKWFNLAAMNGNEEAKRYRLDISADMTKLEIAAAQKAARAWLATKH